MVFVRFFWQAQEQVDGDLRTLLHLYTPSLQQSWATENKGAIRPPTSVWDPASYYIETMRLTLPTDIPPVSYSLVTGLSPSSGERFQVPGSTDGLLHLRELSIAPLRPGRFQRVRPSTVASGGTDDGLQLQGYDLFDGPAGYSFRLFWETGQGIKRNWVTYIHLTDSRGELVAQFDGPALAGLKPTSMWKPNSLYIDSRKLELPAELSPEVIFFEWGYTVLRVERDFIFDLKAQSRTISKTASFLCRSMFRRRCLAIYNVGLMVDDQVVEVDERASFGEFGDDDGFWGAQ